MTLVPLTPGEASNLLKQEPIQRELAEDEEALARLVARGVNASAIAKELGVSLRAVQYRLERMRLRFGVESTTELAVLLSRRGF